MAALINRTIFKYIKHLDTLEQMMPNIYSVIILL